jgi:hypothetical protein
MNRLGEVEVGIRKDVFLGRVRKIELVIKNHSKRSEFAATLNQYDLIMIKSMLEDNLGYFGNGYNITKSEEENGVVMLQINATMGTPNYNDFIAYVPKSQFLQTLSRNI